MSRALVAVLLLGAGLVLVPGSVDRVEADRIASSPRSDTEIPVGISYGNRLLGLSDRDLTRALDDAVALHTPWIRLDLSWEDIQPRSADSYAWTRTDRVIAAAHDRGLQVLGIVTYTPPWARAETCKTFACPPAKNAQFATFAGAVAKRYAGRVAAYEIWNEPNFDMFWTRPNAAAYGDLLSRTTAAIRAADDQAEVILGGLVALYASSGVIDAAQFLRDACYGGRCDVDGVAYHPYTFPHLASRKSNPPSSWERMLATQPGGNGVRAAMTDTGLGDRLIWVTEYGAPTSGDRPGVDHVTEARQSEILVDGLRAAKRDSDVIGGFFWYTWEDLSVYGSNEDGFGLRRTDGSLKPAFTALAGELTPAADAPSLQAPPAQPLAAAKVTPSVKISAKATMRKVRLTVRVRASGVNPTGKITVKVGGKKLKSVRLKNGKAKVTLTKQKKGKRAYKVTYVGNSRINAKTVTSKRVMIR